MSTNTSNKILHYLIKYLLEKINNFVKTTILCKFTIKEKETTVHFGRAINTGKVATITWEPFFCVPKLLGTHQLPSSWCQVWLVYEAPDRFLCLLRFYTDEVLWTTLFLLTSGRTGILWKESNFNIHKLCLKWVHVSPD